MATIMIFLEGVEKHALVEVEKQNTLRKRDILKTQDILKKRAEIDTHINVENKIVC